VAENISFRGGIESKEVSLTLSAGNRFLSSDELAYNGPHMAPTQSDPFKASQSMRSALDTYLAIVLVVSLAIIPTYVSSLIFYNTPPVIFDAAHLVAVLALTLILLRSKLPHREQVLLVLLSVLAMMMIIPARLPKGIITYGPDMIYELQIMQNIAVTGSITFSAPTRYALGYIFTPTFETLLVMVSMILGSSLETVLKYAGPLLDVLTIVFLYGFYRAYLPKKEALLAVFLAGNCFAFLLYATTVHQTLALVFLSVLLYTLTKPGATWRLLTVLMAFATVSSHEFTAIVSSVFFALLALTIVVLSRWFLFKPGPIEKTALKIPALMLTMTFAWLAFVALPFFGTTVGLVLFIAGELLTGSTRAAFPLTVGGSVPNSWERAVGDIGVLVFAATCLAGFLMALAKREIAHYREFLPYGTAGALVFLIGLMSYVRFHQATDLLTRGFIYVYFFAAPLGLYGILRILSKLQHKTVIRQVTCLCLIGIIVAAGVYYQYPRFLVDNTAPMDIEDVRFPLFQWQSAGFFVLSHTGGNTLWGDKIAFDYAGGYGQKNVNVMDITLNLTLAQWVSSTPASGDIVILRQSMTIDPYGNYQATPQAFHEILATHDIVYSSGEVTMVMAS